MKPPPCSPAWPVGRRRALGAAVMVGAAAPPRPPVRPARTPRPLHTHTHTHTHIGRAYTRACATAAPRRVFVCSAIPVCVFQPRPFFATQKSKQCVPAAHARLTRARIHTHTHTHTTHHTPTGAHRARAREREREGGAGMGDRSHDTHARARSPRTGGGRMGDTHTHAPHTHTQTHLRLGLLVLAHRERVQGEGGKLIIHSPGTWRG